MPLCMSDTQAVLLEEQVYLGGRDIHPGSSDTLLIYDFTDDSWDLLNTPTENYALTICDSQLVLVGGRNPVTLNLTDELCVLDADEQHWNESLPSMPIKCCRSSTVSTNHHSIVARWIGWWPWSTGCCASVWWPPMAEGWTSSKSRLFNEVQFAQRYLVPGWWRSTGEGSFLHFPAFSHRYH